MSLPSSVAQLQREHVVMELECLDRMYLNAYLPKLTTKGGIASFFRGYLGLWTGTGVPKEHYRARQWLNWGQEVALKDAQRGDTVVTSREGGHHVALFDRVESGRVYLLGGNQGNRVSIAPFSPSVIQGIRREGGMGGRACRACCVLPAPRRG